LRQNLRHFMLSSPLCDAPAFMREKYEPMLMEKWRLFCEGRPPSVQVYNSTEPPDALAPGPFAPALPPGAPLVQPVLPPSTPTLQQALLRPGNSAILATGSAVPQQGAELPLALSIADVVGHASAHPLVQKADCGEQCSWPTWRLGDRTSDVCQLRRGSGRYSAREAMPSCMSTGSPLVRARCMRSWRGHSHTPVYGPVANDWGVTST